MLQDLVTRTITVLAGLASWTLTGQRILTPRSTWHCTGQQTAEIPATGRYILYRPCIEAPFIKYKMRLTAVGYYAADERWGVRVENTRLFLRSILLGRIR